MLDIERIDLCTAKQVIRLLELENQRLLTRLEQQTRELAGLKNLDSTTQLELELGRLQEQLARMRHQLFGARSEKRPHSGPHGDADDASGSTTKPAPKRRGHGPTRQPMLPVVERPPIELAPDERACNVCRGQLDEWKGQFETSEVITVVERKYIIEKVMRQKYRCRCQAKVRCAPAPLALIPGGRYSLEFAVTVALDKYLDCLALHRQASRMGREGLWITSQTLFDQLLALARLLENVYDVLGEQILTQSVVHIDETTWRFLNGKPSKKWFLWCITNDRGAYFRLVPSRASTVALELLEGYCGTVVSDGYKVYTSLAKKPSTQFRFAFCWSHVRRKLICAEPAYPQCTKALELIRKLYAIERRLPKRHDNGDTDVRDAVRARRARLRRKLSRPITRKLRKWALAQRGLPESSLRKATDYMLELWPGLTAFLDDPDIPLDNNAVERQLRGPVVGRKVHLGSRSENGTKVAEVFYTLIHSAVIAGVEPRRYLLEAARRALEQPGAVLLPHELHEPQEHESDEQNAWALTQKPS